MTTRLAKLISQPFSVSNLSYLIQRRVTYAPFRYWISNRIAQWSPSALRTCIDGEGLTNEQGLFLESLKKDGIASFDRFLYQEIIDRIKEQFEGKELTEIGPPKRSGFNIHNAPLNVSWATFTDKDILGCKEIIAIANHPDILTIASHYLNCVPTISNISLTYRFPTLNKPKGSENFHRDVDEWRFLKFFIYLTDVDTNSGPHCYVKRSHLYPGFTKIQRIPDSQVEGVFSEEDIVEITGKSGDAFLEDTFGIHKGKVATHNPRLMLQVQYSIGPIGLRDYTTKIPYSLAKDLNPYINRLFV